jgi:hypothetical protein
VRKVTGTYVTFATSTSGEFAYTVPVGQPCMLEEVPHYVMRFDRHGKRRSVNTTRAEALRRHI